MNSKVSDIKITSQEFRYGVRLKYVLFPIDIRDIREVLAKNGFELSSIRGLIPTRPFTVDFSGDVGRKGEATVYMDTSHGTLAVYGKSNKDVIEAFEQVSKIIRNELGFDLHSNVWYYEISTHYAVKTGSSPILNISRIVGDNPHFAKINSILGEEVASFSLRLSPKDRLPNDENWFDISIEQDLLLAEVYHVGILFRNSSQESTKNFVLTLDDKIINLVNLIEGKI